MAEAISSVRDFAADKIRRVGSYAGVDYSPIPMEGADPDDDAGLGLDDAGGDSCCSSLSRRERITGFLVCFIAGWILSFSSVAALDAVLTDPGQFAALYTLGNIVSLLGTTCLRGPSAQIERMFAPARRTATIVYLFAIVMTLVCALALHSPLLALLCMAFQCCAMLWYSLSYIPYGHALASRCLRAIFPCCPAPTPSHSSFAGRIAADASEAWAGTRAWAGFGSPHSPSEEELAVSPAAPGPAAATAAGVRPGAVSALGAAGASGAPRHGAGKAGGKGRPTAGFYDEV